MMAVPARFGISQVDAAVLAIVERDEAAGATLGALGFGTRAQPFVELVAVDHADETAVDRHRHRLAGWRDHPCRSHLGLQQMIGNGEIADQPRGNRAAARFDPSGAIEQQHMPPGTRKIGRRAVAPAGPPPTTITS